jgi:hypothetical protein
MTIVVEFLPGDPGTPPHRHPGPAFGLVLEGEMVFEIEGEPARVVRPAWRSGSPGDVIHYQDSNNRDDIAVRYTVTMLCEPDRQMLVLVNDDELAHGRTAWLLARTDLAASDCPRGWPGPTLWSTCRTRRRSTMRRPPSSGPP